MDGIQLIAGDLDLAMPVDVNHPLAQGCAAMFLSIPGLDGGGIWWELLNLNPGALTGMGNANNGWRTLAPPGGWGSMGFNLSGGNTGYVDCGNTPTYQNVGSGPLTLACWLQKNASNSNNAVLGKYTDDGSHGGYLFYFVNDVLRFYIGNGHFVATPSTLTTGQWYHVVGVWDGTNATIYLNGVQSVSGTAGPLLANADNFVIGTYWHNAGQNPFKGYLDGVLVYRRALSASDVGSLYNEARTGYPTLLRRVTPTFQPLPVSTPPATHAYVITAPDGIESVGPGGVTAAWSLAPPPASIPTATPHGAALFDNLEALGGSASAASTNAPPPPSIPHGKVRAIIPPDALETIGLGSAAASWSNVPTIAPTPRETHAYVIGSSDAIESLEPGSGGHFVTVPIFVPVIPVALPVLVTTELVNEPAGWVSTAMNRSSFAPFGPPPLPRAALINPFPVDGGAVAAGIAGTAGLVAVASGPPPTLAVQQAIPLIVEIARGDLVDTGMVIMATPNRTVRVTKIPVLDEPMLAGGLGWSAL